MTPGDTTLATALAYLSSDLDDSTLNVGHGLEQLTAAVRAAVPSYCGLSITVVVDGLPVTATAPDDAPDRGDDPNPDDHANDEDDVVVGWSAKDAATSLVIPLAAINVTADGELVLYASVAGAFVDLAADLAYETATELVTFDLDTRLDAPTALSMGVGGFSVVHQAIGMLIGAGRTPEQARARIAQIAANDGHDLVAAAERIINGVDR